MVSAFYRAFTNPPKWTYALGLGVVLSLLKRHGLPDLPPNILAYISVAFFLFVIAKSVADSYLARIKPLGMSAPEEAPPAPKAPVPCGELSLAELKAFDGSDKSKPLYLACLGDIYDVSNGADFYGPDGPYSCFSGCEANRALAKMSLKAEDCVPNVEGLSMMERDILKDWKAKFESKYPKVGTVKKE